MESGAEINISFESVNLPPITDIIVLGKNSNLDPSTVLHAVNVLSKGDCVLFDTHEHPGVDAVIVSNHTLKKLKWEVIYSVLSKYVFPYIEPGEMVNVELKVIMKQCVNL